MLDSLTKKRIDDLRDILVGKVPDPKSQVEQITIALIYKFMDDMDAESVEFGGSRSFFQGEFEKYGWSRIFSPGMGGHDMLDLYSNAILTMPQNPNIPALFRDIFKNAYLPYRDPETLKSFLKVINEFRYDHSERLGDAFEYLLSVLGSQGEAGQFRTPRHIIEFMVEIIDPKKEETILDPACGTAGFLISSYKHILKHNSSNYSPETDKRIFELGNVELSMVAINSKMYRGDLLTPDGRTRLINGVRGYDISPDMVRLSLVNMYLHGFTDPHIYEYDTLTSEERWNEYYDVIMANPPFMSPKGGIRPHKRFSVQSKRSEVLFVDYIAEHLNTGGRAAVIVPEGIIFQSGTAYKQLRKMLVENYLVGVISLPAGEFNPYSGVKTSILWLDKSLAGKTDKILFVKIENDGFDLGAQRRPVKQNDLPGAFEEIEKYKSELLKGNTIVAFENERFLLVEKTRIAENGDYNLSGERYKIGPKYNSKFPIVSIGKVAKVISGQSPNGKYYNEFGEGLPFYQGKTEFENIYIGHPRTWTTQITKEAINGDILMSVRAPVGPVNLATQKICIGRGLSAIRTGNNILNKFLFYLLKSKEDTIKGGGGSIFDSISRKQIEELEIPLPPLSVQEEIVAELEGYQKIIDGARMVVENYKPHIDIDPDWPMVELGEICDTSSGGTPLKNKEEYYGGNIPWLKSGEVAQGFIYSVEETISELGLKNSSAKIFPINTVLIAMYGATAGKVGILKINSTTNQAVCGVFPNEKIIPEFLYYYMLGQTDYLISLSTGGAQPNISQSIIKKLLIPLPQVDSQQRVVSKIEEELKIISSNKQLIETFEQKIKDRIAKVLGN